jgi:hypothetical protein
MSKSAFLVSSCFSMLSCTAAACSTLHCSSVQLWLEILPAACDQKPPVPAHLLFYVPCYVTRDAQAVSRRKECTQAIAHEQHGSL